MSSEQIARLERIAIAAGNRVDTAPFLRILEERKRLLDALRDGHSCGARECEKRRRAVIAYAEEPGPS